MAEDLEREAVDAEAIAQIGRPLARTEIRWCAGVNGSTCPHRKTVVRTERCPDCTLAHARVRERLRSGAPGPVRMAKVRTPKREAVSPQPQPFERHDDVDEELDDEPDPELEELDAVLHEEASPRRRVAKVAAFKAGTRQPDKKYKSELPEGELPWYARVKPGESMMAAAATEQDRMMKSKEAKQIRVVTNDGGTPTAFKEKLPT